MCSLVVSGSRIGIKNFASLYVGVPIADKTGLKDGRPSVTILWTLDKTCIIPGLNLRNSKPEGFKYLYCLMEIPNFLNLTITIRKNQGKKFHNPFLNNSYHNSVKSHDPDKVIFNFSGHVLDNTEKSSLSKGLNFAIPPKNLNYADFMLTFELLYRDMDSLSS